MVVRQVRSLREVGVDAEVLEIDGRPSSYARAAWRIVRLNIAKKRYDVVHAHTGHSGVLACLQFRCPVVLSYVGYDIDPPEGYREPARRNVERFVFRQLSKAIAATIVKSARSRSRIPPSALGRTTVLPNGVDRSLFRPVDRTAARRRLGWGDEPVVLFAADPSRAVKRFDLALQAMEHAKKHVPDARLAVCKVIAPDEVPFWMNAADVLILTSGSEGSPNVVKEAMACDLPVVAVDVGDVREVVDGTRHCHVCEADPRVLGEALAAVIDALPVRSDGRGRTADLDLTTVARRLHRVYEEATLRRSGVLGFRARSAQAVTS